MSEFMGNLAGTYDAKEKGFVPGSASLHSCMSGHGPEREVFEKVNINLTQASTKELKPEKIGEGSMAFMFETTYIFKITKFAMDDEKLDSEYVNVK
jgi:homogentisate 1,2-dioxygenase